MTSLSLMNPMGTWLKPEGCGSIRTTALFVIPKAWRQPRKGANSGYVCGVRTHRCQPRRGPIAMGVPDRPEGPLHGERPVLAPTFAGLRWASADRTAERAPHRLILVGGPLEGAGRTE